MARKRDSFLICLMSILYLLFFSYMTSPLFPCSYGWDSAFFQLVGAGMTKGYLPYRDFFDMKGPWLFFIEYLAEMIWYGRNGIFIMQCVSFGITTFLCCRIYQRFFNGGGFWDCLFMLLPFFVMMSSTMEGGNLTEEWSLPFLFLPLYFSLDFLIGEKEEHKTGYALIYGFCLGVISLIRVTNSVLICAIVVTVTICLVLQRKWKNLLWNAVAFMVGVFLAFLPPILCFGYHGEIRNMLYCTFIFGLIYGTEGFGFGTGRLFLVTLFFCCVILCLFGLKNRRLWMVAVFNTAGMLIALGMGESTLHDYMLVIPGMMLGVWILLQKRGRKAVTGKGRLLIAGVLVICFTYPVYKMAGTVIIAGRQLTERSVYDHVMETAECIPPEELDFVWGYEVPLRWYTIADIMPCNRYCGWQEHYMELVPEIEEEIAEMFEKEPPIWIVTKASAQISNHIVKYQLDNRYCEYKENDDFVLYRKE